MTQPTARIVPERTEFTDYYWAQAARGFIALQRCLDCGRTWHPHAPTCPGAPAHRTEWFTASGRGRLYSYTRVEHAAHRAVADQLPYVIALIDLEEGPRFICNLLDADASALGPDLAVTVRIGPAVGGARLPVARLTASPTR
jgi:uncharacterized OB-fold protein